ncbi:MAG: 3-hydroxyacyl-CoA dehydrogenase family protein [Bacteroidales bacterium]|nr:3-hydroxyacyl-CoA dehydrogenase family protein [Bacteroidales bacterium]
MSELIENLEEYALSADAKPKAMFSQVGVVGCGSTGQRITLMIATKGIEVVFLEVSKSKIKEAREELEELLNRRIEHWGMTDSEKRSTLSRIKGTVTYADFKNCDLVIESILSKQREFAVEIRKDIFKRIEDNVSPDAIIATNSTNSIITELSAHLEHPNRCISLHFSTTAPEASVVEVVRAFHTDRSICDKVQVFTSLIGKKSIPVAESAGLITVRLFVGLISQACDVWMEGVSTIEEIDLAMKNGLGSPLGPFEFADKAGIDRLERWMENLFNEFGEQQFKAPPIIKRLVRAGHSGRKSGMGFYQYDEKERKIGVNPNIRNRADKN